MGIAFERFKWGGDRLFCRSRLCSLRWFSRSSRSRAWGSDRQRFTRYAGNDFQPTPNLTLLEPVLSTVTLSFFIVTPLGDRRMDADLISFLCFCYPVHKFLWSRLLSSFILFRSVADSCSINIYSRILLLHLACTVLVWPFCMNCN